jgi:hypothetical protein
MLAAYLVGQLPAGALADRFGGLRVLLFGLALWSAATALTALATAGGGLAAVYASRLLLGAASACAMPCVSAAAVAWVPAAARAGAVSSVYALFNVGAAPLQQARGGGRGCCVVRVRGAPNGHARARRQLWAGSQAASRAVLAKPCTSTRSPPHPILQTGARARANQMQAACWAWHSRLRSRSPLAWRRPLLLPARSAWPGRQPLGHTLL